MHFVVSPIPLYLFLHVNLILGSVHQEYLNFCDNLLAFIYVFVLTHSKNEHHLASSAPEESLEVTP